MSLSILTLNKRLSISPLTVVECVDRCLYWRQVCQYILHAERNVINILIFQYKCNSRLSVHYCHDIIRFSSFSSLIMHLYFDLNILQSCMWLHTAESSVYSTITLIDYLLTSLNSLFCSPSLLMHIPIPIPILTPIPIPILTPILRGIPQINTGAHSGSFDWRSNPQSRVHDCWRNNRICGCK